MQEAAKHRSVSYIKLWGFCTCVESSKETHFPHISKPLYLFAEVN